MAPFPAPTAEGHADRPLRSTQEYALLGKGLIRSLVRYLRTVTESARDRAAGHSGATPVS